MCVTRGVGRVEAHQTEGCVMLNWSPWKGMKLGGHSEYLKNHRHVDLVNLENYVLDLVIWKIMCQT
jgi:hypothetical protein